ncbi:MAG: ATP-binding protein [Leptolyngbyaceae cyanobacterium bins.59]|nr:ATP-binding protein [Leptolyngbyaceae cyanobacterium bins.59]
MTQAKILIVEDETIIALDIQNSVMQAGYGVPAIASSGSEALAQVMRYQPDLVLMDIRLQGELDGIDAAQQIQNTCNVPIVFLTAHADENTLIRARTIAPFGYVLKPFEDHQLITAIEIALKRHQAEVAALKALQKEREFSDLKSRFISIVSHEFRNPLSTIQFSTDMLQRYPEKLSAEKRQTHLQRIQVSIQRMSRLLNDVLILEQVDAGKLQFSPLPVNLVEFCEELIEEVRVNDHQGHRIEWSWQDLRLHSRTSRDDRTQSWVQIDEQLLRHILVNLLSNAVKYSPPDTEIRVSLVIQDRTVMFQVQDQGIGIPEGDREQLFTSFYRASNVKATPGNGLGLSIVKQCVETHGGNISVESQVGIGSCFTVILPT